MLAATRLKTLAIASALAFGVLFLIFDLTKVGEYWDDQAHLGREMFLGHIHHVLNRFLDMINIGSIIVVIIVAVVIIAVRRNIQSGSIILGAFVATIVLGEVLKRVLPRKEFGNMDANLDAFDYNTFPSGHCTIATASVLALVLLSNASWRPYVAIAGAAWASLIASGVLAAGWHRPSDAIAGICVATAGVSLAAAYVIPRWWSEVRAPRISTWLWSIGALLLVVISAALIATLISPATAPPESRVVLGDFMKASIVIDACAIGVVSAVAWLTRSVDAVPAPRAHVDQ